MLISQHLERLRQEECLKASLGYTMKSCLKRYTEKQSIGRYKIARDSWVLDN